MSDFFFEKNKQGVGDVYLGPQSRWVLEAAQPQENFAIFTFIQTDLKLVYKYENLSLKTCKLGPTLSYKLCLKDYRHNLTKYEIKGSSKIPISLLFSELGKIQKHNIGLYSKNPIFHLFHELGKGKTERSSQNNI